MKLPISRCLLTAAALCLASAQSSAAETLEMEGISIIGSKESPKALFIVPWKDAESPLAPERPLNSLLNDKPRPIDPDVFRRYLRYFDQVHNSTLKTGENPHDNN